MGSSVELDIRHMTFEVSESVRQIVSAFEIARNEIDGDDLIFSNVGRIVLWGSLYHFHAMPQRMTKSFDRSTDSYFVSCIPIDYAAWVEGDWRRRTNLLAEAGKVGVTKVAKTRITPREREAAIEMIDRMASIVVASAPANLAPIAPSDWKPMVEAEPSMFKLHAWNDGAWTYYEAWLDDSHVVTLHTGVCGQQGTTEVADHLDRISARATLTGLEVNGLKLGYRAIPESRLSTLVVDIPATDSDYISLLDRRHALEDLLDRELGWLGLGHCDGGDIGGAEASVFCLVVSYSLAVAPVRDLLDRHGYANTQIRRSR